MLILQVNHEFIRWWWPLDRDSYPFSRSWPAMAGDRLKAVIGTRSNVILSDGRAIVSR
jgi:hypothetical protein